MKIYINKYFKDNRLEKFLDFKYEVYSRSGINETEKRLIKKLPELNEPRKILILENRTGVIGMIASDLFPEAEITLQNVDKYHSDKIEHNLKHNEVTRVKVLCQADIDGKYDAIYYQQTQANLVKEFVLDLVQQCHAALNKNGKLFLAMEKKEKVITGKMQELFGGATIDNLTDKGLLLIAKKKNNPVEYIDYRADFVLSSDEGNRIAYRSYPGVFAHHRVDEGAKAMLELVEVNDGDTLLDMGCGIGSIGIALARQKKLAKVFFVDSNSRAIKATEFNCENNKMENYQTILSASGFTAPKKCQVFVGNPPYFSDFRIAGIFVEAAHANLLKGSKAWFVAKNPQKLKEIIKEQFGNCEVIKHHGYNILVGVR
ncbi:MAG: methyltransferase [Candidatus Cloacimonetes bacterium]|nr:methyltransferase [Candidatus Cloacimonadota bacterium]